MTNYVTTTSDKSKKTALLLCLLGGIFGLHYFYVGRIQKGFIFAFTFGFFFFGLFADLITIATGSFRDSSGAALRK